MKKIATIIDYGLGNILSAKQSFLKVANDNNIDAEVIITNNPEDVKKSTHIILPGQGAFKSCMSGLLNIKNMIKQIEIEVIENKKPFLGICVGMQLLADVSFENGKHFGLGWIKGEIKKLPSSNRKLPHMGWNEVLINNNNPNLLKEGESKDFYFVHSYYFECKYKDNIVGLTNYGINFASFISKENIYGVQFHPEKSSLQGLNLIKNFLKL
tara:strand:+ start:621 stop:1256 length:636 start_codon:yes stop_codon:yes gene_type:complete